MCVRTGAGILPAGFGILPHTLPPLSVGSAGILPAVCGILPHTLQPLSSQWAYPGLRPGRPTVLSVLAPALGVAQRFGRGGRARELVVFQGQDLVAKMGGALKLKAR